MNMRAAKELRFVQWDCLRAVPIFMEVDDELFEIEGEY